MGTVTPNDGGRCRQAQPLVNTNTIAVNTARGSVRERPPPCGRYFADGIKGSTNAHNSSGTNRCDSESITTQDHPSITDKIQTRHALNTIQSSGPDFLLSPHQC
ncbi:hypothetical protein GCM10017566_45830 [Amycolatopsis bartoniae]|uniref:Uncharacterized protein n=1 Tax=Amycolatopsis bartoniae TaxID=941986 RepID=A0A8H9MF08_9PSEU|nr:hypothetical protein GCM10017566_45830 [Amycolatopsis bartoniae]